MKTMIRISAALIFAAALVHPGRAAAYQKDIGGGYGLYLEPAFGFLVPAADDDYDDIADISFKLAFLRIGYLFKAGPVYLGPELASDFTPYTHDLPEDAHFYRIRTLACLRLVIPMPPHPRIRILFRVGMGLGVVWADYEGWHDRHVEDDAGFVMDMAAGVEYQVHKRITIGMTLGFPVGVYPDDYDFVTFDVDFLWHVSFYVWP